MQGFERKLKKISGMRLEVIFSFLAPNMCMILNMELSFSLMSKLILSIHYIADFSHETAGVNIVLFF